MRKVTKAVMAPPMLTNVLSLPGQMGKPRPSVLTPPAAAMIGFTMLVVKAVTSAVKAVPTTTAMDSSITLPRRMKSLNPLSMGPPVFGSVGDLTE
ncbi:hypothetical protein D9M72_464220 [compost metagenome]